MPPREGREGQESGGHEPKDARPRSGGDPIRTSSGNDALALTRGKNQSDQGGNDTSSRNEREDLSNDNSDHDPYGLDRDTNLDPFSSDSYEESHTGPPPPDPPTGKMLDAIAAELGQESKESVAEYQEKVDTWNRKVWGEASSLSRSQG